MRVLLLLATVTALAAATSVNDTAAEEDAVTYFFNKLDSNHDGSLSMKDSEWTSHSLDLVTRVMTRTRSRPRY